ncbi:MAG: Gfo/Idh/MocA family oxidoreductase [Fibrobacter sp.]|nr:Gfo/Idh/MocA family oxidoreductase [Fibrobacter sp.]
MELAEQKQKVLQIGHSERFNPAFKVFQELMEANIVGDIYRMEINRSGPFPQQKINAGATIDLAVHDLEIVSRLMKNKKPLGVFAYSEKRIAKKFEDGITALFRFENEILVQITANWLSPRKNRYISVYGYKGLLHCDLFHQKVIFYENKHKRDKADEYGIGGIEEGAKVSYEVPKWEPLAAEHNEFFDNIAAGKNDTESLETASTAVYLANLVMKAANAETHQIKR